MLTEKQIILIVIIFILIILLFINKDTVLNTFQNNPTTTSELDENGFIKSNLVPSYWYNYETSESRSKCFDCDANKKFKHGSNCIDCETKGGRPIDKLFNRVMTR